MQKTLQYLRELDRLKSVERQSPIYTGGRRENSAEHSWHLAMAVLAFVPQARERLDLSLALRFALLHDVVEIDAGDTFVYGDQNGKAEKEQAAAARIFGILGGPTGAELRALWERYEQRDTPEARFVNALDRFLPIYGNLLNGGGAWKRHGISRARVAERNCAQIEPELPELWAWVSAELDAAVARGDLAAG